MASTTPTTLLHLLGNLTYVSVDRDKALNHWCKMTTHMNSQFFQDNWDVLVRQKAVAGALGHKRSRGFCIHLIKERRVLRNAA